MSVTLATTRLAARRNAFIGFFASARALGTVPGSICGKQGGKDDFEEGHTGAHGEAEHPLEKKLDLTEQDETGSTVSWAAFRRLVPSTSRANTVDCKGTWSKDLPEPPRMEHRTQSQAWSAFHAKGHPAWIALYNRGWDVDIQNFTRTFSYVRDIDALERELRDALEKAGVVNATITTTPTEITVKIPSALTHISLTIPLTLEHIYASHTTRHFISIRRPIPFFPTEMPKQGSLTMPGGVPGKYELYTLQLIARGFEWKVTPKGHPVISRTFQFESKQLAQLFYKPVTNIVKAKEVSENAIRMYPHGETFEFSARRKTGIPICTLVWNMYLEVSSWHTLPKPQRPPIPPPKALPSVMLYSRTERDLPPHMSSSEPKTTDLLKRNRLFGGLVQDEIFSEEMGRAFAKSYVSTNEQRASPPTVHPWKKKPEVRAIQYRGRETKMEDILVQAWAGPVSVSDVGVDGEVEDVLRGAMEEGREVSAPPAKEVELVEEPERPTVFSSVDGDQELADLLRSAWDQATLPSPAPSIPIPPPPLPVLREDPLKAWLAQQAQSRPSHRDVEFEEQDVKESKAKATTLADVEVEKRQRILRMLGE